MPTVFIDVETTGLDPIRNRIWQVGFVVRPLVGPVEHEEEFSFCPNSLKWVDFDALERSGMTVEKIQALPPQDEVLPNIVSWLKARSYDEYITFAGYNVSFDLEFFERLLIINDTPAKRFHSLRRTKWHLDVLQLARWWAWCFLYPADPEHKPENFKLATIAKFLKIEFDENKLHSALANARLAHDVAYKIWHDIHQDIIDGANVPESSDF